MDRNLERMLAEVLEIPVTTITDDLEMKNVEIWDSLKHMELVMSLENHFGIQFSFDDIVTMKSVREIKRVLGEKANS